MIMLEEIKLAYKQACVKETRGLHIIKVNDIKKVKIFFNRRLPREYLIVFEVRTGKNASIYESEDCFSNGTII